MDVRQLRISRRSVTIAAALVGLVSLAIGAHAALNKRSLDAAKAIATEQNSDVCAKASRVALVIGNGHYPDASRAAGAADQRRPRPDGCAARQGL